MDDLIEFVRAIKLWVLLCIDHFEERHFMGHQKESAVLDILMK